MVMIVTFTLVPGCFAAQHPTDDREQAPQLSGQERAGLITAIKVARQAGEITVPEEQMLYFLIEKGYGYPQMLRDYIKEYKRKGHSMDEFIQDLYNGKLPKKD
jgi:hypothetical protein